MAATAEALPREDPTQVPDVPAQSAIQTPGPSPDEAEEHARQMNMIDPYFYTQKKVISTFKWDQSVGANTMLWFIELKPSNMHELLDYISQMYATWSGDFDFDTIVAGTGFNGGRIAIAWIPPTVHPNDVTNWSTYPYILMDPKNQTAEPSCGADFRQVAFHWNENTYTTGFQTVAANNRGGYLAIFVAMPLIVTGSGTPYVEVMVLGKCAENFRFHQIIDVPQRLIDRGPTFDLNIKSHPTFPRFQLKEMRVSTTSREDWQGIDSLYKLDGTPLTTGVTSRDLFFNTWSHDGRNVQGISCLNAREAGRIHPQCRLRIGTEGQILGLASCGVIEGGNFTESTRPEIKGIDCSIRNTYAGNDGDRDCWNLLIPGGGEFPDNLYSSWDRDNGIELRGEHQQAFETTSDDHPDIVIEPENGENIVYFCFEDDQEGFGTLTMQTVVNTLRTKEWDLTNADGIPRSYVFDVVDKNTGQVVSVIRLNPQGFFSATTTSFTLIFDLDEIELRFREILPVLTPLPAVPIPGTAAVRFQTRKIEERTQNTLATLFPERKKEILAQFGKVEERMDDLKLNIL